MMAAAAPARRGAGAAGAARAAQLHGSGAARRLALAEAARPPALARAAPGKPARRRRRVRAAAQQTAGSTAHGESIEWRSRPEVRYAPSHTPSARRPFSFLVTPLRLAAAPSPRRQREWRALWRAWRRAAAAAAALASRAFSPRTPRRAAASSRRTPRSANSCVPAPRSSLPRLLCQQGFARRLTSRAQGPSAGWVTAGMLLRMRRPRAARSLMGRWSEGCLTVSADDTVAQAVRLMAAHEVGCLVALEPRTDAVAGVITVRSMRCALEQHVCC